MSGHTPWKDIQHKASPERLADARAELQRAITLTAAFGDAHERKARGSPAV